MSWSVTPVYTLPPLKIIKVVNFVPVVMTGEIGSGSGIMKAWHIVTCIPAMKAMMTAMILMIGQIQMTLRSIWLTAVKIIPFLMTILKSG